MESYKVYWNTKKDTYVQLTCIQYEMCMRTRIVLNETFAIIQIIGFCDNSSVNVNIYMKNRNLMVAYLTYARSWLQ